MLVIYLYLNNYCNDYLKRKLSTVGTKCKMQELYLSNTFPLHTYDIHSVSCESLCLSTPNVACTPLIYAIAAAPLLVVAACGTDEGLKGRVTCCIILTLYIGSGSKVFRPVAFPAVPVPPTGSTTAH